MNDLSGQILGITDQVTASLQGLRLTWQPFAILDILIVSILFYWIYLFLRETRAMRILYGIAILGSLLLIGRIFELTLLNFVMKYLVTSILVAIPVVFQPELRAALERLGRTRFVTTQFPLLRRVDIPATVTMLSEATNALAKRKIGALIVLTGRTGLKDFIETGTELDANLSRELLWNIFTPKTPLHDGAVIIEGNKIVAASTRLPLSEEQFSGKFGTRHRAALGLSAQSDALVIVVSEETGRISTAREGVLSQDMTQDELAQKIRAFYFSLSRKDNHAA